MEKSIYIIEDDPDLLTILTVIFKKNGFKVVADHSGLNLDFLKADSPDIYLVDYNLPGTNGASICQRVKQASDRTPVVMMSANAKLEEYAKSCKADAFIAKPFDTVNMVSLIKGLVSRSKS